MGPDYKDVINITEPADGLMCCSVECLKLLEVNPEKGINNGDKYRK
jgi:hypothetical protein